MTQGLRTGLELGPLLIFFAVNAISGIFAATAVLMGTSLIALIALRMIDKRWPMMPMVTSGLILVFGGLTLWLADETFIKLKPTIIYILFATGLTAGLALKRNFLKVVFRSAFHLDEAGWRSMTWRWVLFFVCMAMVNEMVWRTQSTDTWVAFKVFGFLPLTMAFGLAQIPLIKRHQVDEDSSA